MSDKDVNTAVAKKVSQADAQKISDLLRAACDRGNEAEKATRGKGRFIRTDEGIVKELNEAREFAAEAIAKIDSCLSGEGD